MIFQTLNGGQRTAQEAAERFLFGSLQYAFAISADRTAFRTTPIENGGYPGFAHANLTVPGTPGPLQPGTPLKVKEVRLGVYLWP